MKNEKAIIRRCSKCLFSGEYRDMGASCGVCTLEKDLVKAINRFNECEKVGCNDFCTKEMVIAMREKLDKYERRDVQAKMKSCTVRYIDSLIFEDVNNLKEIMDNDRVMYQKSMSHSCPADEVRKNQKKYLSSKMKYLIVLQHYEDFCNIVNEDHKTILPFPKG